MPYMFLQIILLLQSCVSHESSMDTDVSQQQIGVHGGNFGWLAILWERGLFHDNPHGSINCLEILAFDIILLFCILISFIWMIQLDA